MSDSTGHKIKEFIKRHKKALIIAGGIYVVLMVVLVIIGVSFAFSDKGGDDYSYTPPKDQFPRVEVNGLSVQEACSKLQDKGWAINSVYGNTEDYSDSQISDCDKADGLIYDVDYQGDKVSLYYHYKKDTAKTPEPKQEEKKPEAPKPKARYAVSEDAAEHFCQDAGLLNKYIDSKQIGTIYVTNYNKRYTDSFSYDKNGNNIKFFQWNGKYKSSGEAASFSCWISGSSDTNITLHKLSLDGVNLYGDDSFERYNESGKKVE